MKRTFAGSFLLVVLVASTTPTLAPRAAAAGGPVSISFEKYELANGLDVILHEDHSTPTVAVNVWYHVGSTNEKRGRTGFAHLFEHMMFQGSEHHKDEYFAPLEKLGANINGSTSEDRTNYFEDVPSNALELALWLESDRMGFLLPAMTQESLDNQRDVVKNERRQGVDNEPYGRAFEILGEMIYPPEHPYSWPVIGSMEDLSAASMEDVSEFFRTYYTPSNASLCIAGDFDPKTAKALVEKYFGSIPPGRTIDRIQSWVPRLDTVKRAVSTDNVVLPRVYMAWPTPALFAPGDSHFDLLANALSSGKTSRLYRSLVYDKQIAQDIQAVQFSGGIASAFLIIATAREGHTLDEIEAAIDAELRRVLAEGVTAEELAQAQTAWEASFVRRIEPVGSFGGRADLLNQYNTMLGDPGRVGWDLDRYLKVNVAELQQYVKRYIDLDRRVILRIVPKGELTAAADSGVDRTREPGLGPDPAFTPPTIQKASLANGLQLLLVEDHDLPLVQANVVIRSGWGSDPTERLGTAALTSAVLDEGTKTRSAMQIAEESKRLGAALGTDSSFDSTEVSINVLKRNLDPALDLMADIVLNANFPGEELERQRQITLGQIAQESKEPFSAGVNTFMQRLYGPGHPYGQPFSGTGTEASVRALTRDDLAAFHKAWFAPDNAAVVISGDITLEEARTKVDRVFRAWKKGNVTPKAIPAPPTISSTRIVLVDKPGAAQSLIAAGHTGMPRKAADFLAFEVMNNALGSQFTSRINMNLREDKGYSYGASSFLLATRGVGPFICFAPVQTQNTKESVAEIVKEMRDVIGSRPLANSELTDSRNNLIKGFPQRFEGIGSIAGELAALFVQELPADEWATYRKRVAAIDGPAATKAAKDHLHPEALLIVVVGDREKVEAGLKELKLGPVEVAKGSDLDALQEYLMMLPPPHRTKSARLPFGLLVILLISTAQPATAWAKKSAAASLEDAVVLAPADPTQWLALAKFHDAREEVAPTALSYVRALTLSLDPDSAKHAATRLWALLIPKPGESAAGGISLKLADKASIVWAPTELVLSMARFTKDSGDVTPEVAAMSDVQYFALAMENLIIFVEDERRNRKLGVVWRKHVIPYLLEARERGHVEGLAYCTLASLSLPEVEAWMEANAERLAAYRSWTQQWKPEAKSAK